MSSIQPANEIRLLHTADVHIFSPASLAHITSVADAANRLRADLLLIAGDFFDGNRVDLDVAESALRKLRRLEMPAVLLPGNHDQLDAESIYHRLSLDRLCPALRFISRQEGESVSFPNLRLSVWGRAMQEHTPDFHPLEGSPLRDGQRWHVGMAHGFHFPPGETPDRSSPILARDIAATDFDYIALGHCHVFRDVSYDGVSAFYSGAPEPVHPGAGPSRAVLVHLHPVEGVRVEQMPLF